MFEESLQNNTISRTQKPVKILIFKPQNLKYYSKNPYKLISVYLTITEVVSNPGYYKIITPSILLNKVDEIHDGSSNRVDQRWNNSSDDDNDDGSPVYNWKTLNKQIKSEKQTEGKF